MDHLAFDKLKLRLTLPEVFVEAFEAYFGADEHVASDGIILSARKPADSAPHVRHTPSACFRAMSTGLLSTSLNPSRLSLCTRSGSFLPILGGTVISKYDFT